MPLKTMVQEAPLARLEAQPFCNVSVEPTGKVAVKFFAAPTELFVISTLLPVTTLDGVALMFAKTTAMGSVTGVVFVPEIRTLCVIGEAEEELKVIKQL